MIQFTGIRTVMAFTPDPERAARWWAATLGVAARVEPADSGPPYAWLDVSGVEFGFHPADDARNPRGASPVPYWSVDDVLRVRSELLAAGCTHHRGPLRIADDRLICQLTDPFGTVIGLDGP